MSDVEQLVEGYRRFHHRYFLAEDNQLFAQLVLGQKPNTLVVACSDSRVDPALVMDCKPGDLFVVRNVANLVPPYEKGGGYHGVSASLEFAVCVLGVRNVIVLGHRQCGGIKALFEGMPGGMEGEFIKPWVSMAKRAADQVRADYPDASDDEKMCHCEMGGVLVSLENLRTFPFIRQQLEKDQLRLHGWYFDIVTGQMRAYNQQNLTFEPLIP
jgi:carbonic anhydrase